MEAVCSFKYRGAFSLTSPLTKELVRAARPLLSEGFIVMPVPLHGARLRERGYNQSLLLARGLVRALSEFSLELDFLTLKRTRLTRPQAELDKAERTGNVKGAFELTAPSLVRGRDVLLIDDVYTTGATVAECSKVLKKAGARVSVLTLARAVRL